jgi:PAS domain S-box-containing protein
MSDGAQERIRELEGEVAVLRTLLAAAPAFIGQIALDGRILFLNHTAPGFRSEEVMGAPVTRFVHPEVAPRVEEALRRVVATKRTETLEGLAPSSSETMGHYVGTLSPILHGDVVTSVVLVATEVTDLVDARDRLRESQARVQLALDATGMGIWTYDPATDRGTWDPNTRRIFGVDGAEDAPGLVGLLRDLIHPDDRDRVRAAVDAGLASGTYGPIEHRIVTPAGALRWVQAWGAVMNRGGGSPTLLGSVVDVTERRASDARLLEAEKLESIARLAGGIAHDFNNMLTAMNVNVELLLRGSPDDRQRAMLREIRHASDRSAALTKQLLAFARRQIIEPRFVDPNQIVGDVARLLGRVLGARIAVQTRLDARRRVRVDPTQLEQVLLNLATNARDAMPDGGQVELATADVAIEHAEAARMRVSPGSHVRITVRDTGSGIPPEVLPHVFEPFYSTRPGGTGLGLATCWGIAKQSFGDIDIQSAPGQGTTVTLHLPAHEAYDATGSDERPAARESARGECVLVVEDEHLVRTVVARTLEAGGYRVRAVDGPQAAIEAFDEGGAFDLLVTDVVMPGMTGPDLARRLLERSPGLPVLLISGYSDAILRGEEARSPRMRFLPKPFSSETLLEVVREMLRAARHPAGAPDA